MKIFFYILFDENVLSFNGTIHKIMNEQSYNDY